MPVVAYKNGNYFVELDTETGTKVRFNDLDYFESDRPESMDVKITNKCGRGCPWCHENSTMNGKEATKGDMITFVKNAPRYCEVAVGGGNVMENPDHTEYFLRLCRTYRLIPSITVHQKDFKENYNRIKYWYDNKLVYGIGVSLHDAFDSDFWTLYETLPTAVIHIIEGVITYEELSALLTHPRAKMLTLGYKNVRRGTDYIQDNYTKIYQNRQAFINLLPRLLGELKVCSFDNLALEHLPQVRELVGEEVWQTNYLGDDGTTSFYVDLVDKEFALSSTAIETRTPIGGRTVMEMYNDVRSIQNDSNSL